MYTRRLVDNYNVMYIQCGSKCERLISGTERLGIVSYRVVRDARARLHDTFFFTRHVCVRREEHGHVHAD